MWKLPETLPTHQKASHSLWKTLVLLSKDKRVLRLGFLVGACNGIGFSYYGEGSFYLIDLLGLTPSLYGNTFIAIAIAGAFGAFISRKLHATLDSLTIMKWGVITTVLGGLLFVVQIMALTFWQAPSSPHSFLGVLGVSILISGEPFREPNFHL